MRLAILGGSFNPLHIGHAMLADVMLCELHYDKLLFIPTCKPPHKEISARITTEQRTEMVRRFCASEGGGRLELETCELDRGGVSYTIDTLEYVLEKYGRLLDGKPALLMGEEIAAEFSKWKSPELVASLADLVIVPRRPGSCGSNLSQGKADDGIRNKPLGGYRGDFGASFNPEGFSYPHKLLDIPVLTVSSTEIRARIAGGKSFRYLVPRAVYEYIEEERLYR